MVSDSGNLPWVEKYRPSSLSDLVSQEEIVNSISKMIAEDRLPHLLFYGPPGTGKTTTILAAARKMFPLKGMKSRLLELNASDERGIDVVRNKIVSFASSQGLQDVFSSTNTSSAKRPIKLVILDEADAMTKDAQNALRRIIEKFRFAPLKQEQVMPRIDYIIQKEELNVTDDGKDALFKLSKGDMRRIINVLQSTALATDVINEKGVYSCVGYPRPNVVEKILRILLDSTIEVANQKLSEMRLRHSVALMDILDELTDKISKMDGTPKLLQILYDGLSAIEQRLSAGCSERIQIKQWKSLNDDGYKLFKLLINIRLQMKKLKEIGNDDNSTNKVKAFTSTFMGDSNIDEKISENENNKEKQINTLNLLLSNEPINGPNSAFFEEVRLVANQQLQHALADVSKNNTEGWELFVEDGNLKMYKLENEIDGIVIDPLKALHCIDGVTAREFIDIFFDPFIKQEWDDTIQSCVIIEQLSPDSVFLHQVHRRIWPTATRESLFWSQRLNVSSKKSSDAFDAWMVCNKSTNRKDVELSSSSAVRVKFTIAMLCQTILKTNKPIEELTRDDIQCKIVYVAEVHPGGWVPKIGVRQVYKKEYPKFLRTFMFISSKLFQVTNQFSSNIGNSSDRRQIEILEKQINELKNRLEGMERIIARKGVDKIEKFIPKNYPKVKFRNEMNRKRILITGGAGFVGSHLVDRLMLDGHEVIALDNFFTGRRRNIERWIGHPNFELVHHDVVNAFYSEVDQIYHLASPASPPHYMYNPVKTLKTNILGTLNMLGMARRVKARILFASSSEIYGDPKVSPQSELYFGYVNTIGPRSCYDEGKRVGESLLMAFYKHENVDIRIARIFNTFGPRMHINDGRVVSNFITQSLQGMPITVYGNGNQTRSFQYISDLITGLISLMESNTTLPVNIGNPEEYSILEFAKIVKNLIGGNSKIIHTEKMTDDPQKRRPDITRAKEFLGWEPKVQMIEGLHKTIEYFKGELEQEKLLNN
uniref:UDP-glucuronic acid decarboxylase 1 n=1 Tax=Meloidogyne javanica TaxID=6303 RepID=A0A915LYU9_MELJA